MDRNPSSPVDEGRRAATMISKGVRASGSARAWLRTVLSGWAASDELTSDGLLVVSELVANAVVHSSGDVDVRVAQDDDGSLQLAVSDGGTALPKLVEPTAGRVGGFGLRIVDRLASDWGVSPFAGGKVVWATLSADRPAGD